MSRRGPKGTWQVVLLLIVAFVLWALEQRNSGSPGPKRPPSSAAPHSGAPSPSTDPDPGPGAGPVKAPGAKPVVRGEYEEFTGCHLVEHRQNDGDSFHVRLPDGRVEQFRLYFVDAPESAFRSYAGGANNHDRIAGQAKDFGISGEQAVEIGKQAKERVHGLLSRGDFVLHTAWDDPYGDRRYHAFVRPSTSAAWLHETLVREGLVRIRTKPADLPDGTPASAQLLELRELEDAAKRARRGAWGL